MVHTTKETNDTIQEVEITLTTLAIVVETTEMIEVLLVIIVMKEILDTPSFHKSRQVSGTFRRLLG